MNEWWCDEWGGINKWSRRVHQNETSYNKREARVVSACSTISTAHAPEYRSGCKRDVVQRSTCSLSATAQLQVYFFLAVLNSTVIGHFLYLTYQNESRLEPAGLLTTYIHTYMFLTPNIFKIKTAGIRNRCLCTEAIRTCCLTNMFLRYDPSRTMDMVYQVNLPL